MNAAIVQRVLAPRYRGAGGLATAAVRVAGGVAFVLFSLGKFVEHAQEVEHFDHYGIPVPEVAVYAVGVLELVGGVLLILGFLTRPAALALALNMVGAISTAGRVDGGSFHLGVGPTMLVVMLLLVWAGAGHPSVDDRLTRERGPAAGSDRLVSG